MIPSLLWHNAKQRTTRKMLAEAARGHENDLLYDSHNEAESAMPRRTSSSDRLLLWQNMLSQVHFTEVII